MSQVTLQLPAPSNNRTFPIGMKGQTPCPQEEAKGGPGRGSVLPSTLSYECTKKNGV